MANVYILYSNSREKYYIGSCKDFEKRLQEHIDGKYANSYTAHIHDWQPFLIIPNLKYLQARAKEKHIKRMKSRRYLLILKTIRKLLRK
ncbi:MAG: GIY-YIG nuclease family protein [Bacteroidales bacterium]|nr:GIY-YIG nuclease family protein [Bacteroidales bacterium]